jgi:hypothetical protein
LLGEAMNRLSREYIAQDSAPHETSASRVVWHFVARSLVNPSNGTSQVIGYFTDLDGVSVSLFR